jgi:hypothetical protein
VSRIRPIAAARAERFLAGFTGIMQADAFSGFGRLYEASRQPGPVTSHDAEASSNLPSSRHDRRSRRTIFLSRELRDTVFCQPQKSLIACPRNHAFPNISAPYGRVASAGSTLSCPQVSTMEARGRENPRTGEAKGGLCAL